MPAVPGACSPAGSSAEGNRNCPGAPRPRREQSGAACQGELSTRSSASSLQYVFFFPHYQAFHPGEQRMQRSTSLASSLLRSAACPRFWPPAWCSDFSQGCRRYPQQTTRTYSGQAREVSELPVLHPAAAQQSPARPSRTNHHLSAAHNRTRRPLPKRFSFKKVRKERYWQQPACAP